MAFEFNTLRDQEEEMAEKVFADRRVFLDATKSKLVEDGDPKAAFLLAAEGAAVPDEFVSLYKPKKRKATKAVKPAEDK